MAKYFFCLFGAVAVFALVLQTCQAVPVALKRDSAPKYPAKISLDDGSSSDRSRTERAAAIASTAQQGLIAGAGIAGTISASTTNSVDDLTAQLNKLKEQVELYQMINDMLKAETQVQKMPYVVDQDEPKPVKPEATVPATAAAATEEHHDEEHHEDDDHHHDDGHHHDDDHDYDHHEEQHQQQQQQQAKVQPKQQQIQQQQYRQVKPTQQRRINSLHH
jgi:hypothetical protein